MTDGKLRSAVCRKPPSRDRLRSSGETLGNFYNRTTNFA